MSLWPSLDENTAAVLFSYHSFRKSEHAMPLVYISLNSGSGDLTHDQMAVLHLRAYHVYTRTVICCHSTVLSSTLTLLDGWQEEHLSSMKPVLIIAKAALLGNSAQRELTAEKNVG